VWFFIFGNTKVKKLNSTFWRKYFKCLICQNLRLDYISWKKSKKPKKYILNQTYNYWINPMKINIFFLLDWEFTWMLSDLIINHVNYWWIWFELIRLIYPRKNKEIKVVNFTWINTFIKITSFNKIFLEVQRGRQFLFNLKKLKKALWKLLEK